ncbi:MAG: cobalamin-binding protein [Planctomycetota bacterium]|nr:MAG: cobalamin-binding protein [Planctomycetota bacterium]
MRVVSLLPSATETLDLVGGSGMLVGRSHECDHPASILDRPVLTAPATAPGPPARIDAEVRLAVEQGRSLYRLDADRLADLRPDVILTQDLCSVCSIDLGAVRSAAARLDPTPKIVSLNPTTIEGVFDDVLTVGAAVGLESSAETAVVHLRERFYRTAECVPAFDEGPSVAFLEWTDPLFVGGHWTPQLVERAGGRHPLNPTEPIAGLGSGLAAQQDQRTAGPSRRITPDELIESRPEAVVVCPCGVGLDQGRIAASTLAGEPWWPDLPAVRAGRVALVDGNQMFNRPGPRLVEAFGWLTGWLNDRPGLIPPGFPWEPMP